MPRPGKVSKKTYTHLLGWDLCKYICSILYLALQETHSTESSQGKSSAGLILSWFTNYRKAHFSVIPALQC